MFNLSVREKNIISAGLVFLVLFFGFQMGISPVFEKRDTLKRILGEKKTALKEMTGLAKQIMTEYSTAASGPGSEISRPSNFSLFSFIDSQVQKSNLKKSVDSMKPSSKKDAQSRMKIDIVKVKLNQVYLKELIDFIYSIEASPNGVSIGSLSLSKSGKNKDLLDAVIEAQAFIPEKTGAE